MNKRGQMAFYCATDKCSVSTAVNAVASFNVYNQRAGRKRQADGALMRKRQRKHLYII